MPICNSDLDTLHDLEERSILESRNELDEGQKGNGKNSTKIQLH